MQHVASDINRYLNLIRLAFHRRPCDRDERIKNRIRNLIKKGKREKKQRLVSGFDVSPPDVVCCKQGETVTTGDLGKFGCNYKSSTRWQSTTDPSKRGTRGIKYVNDVVDEPTVAFEGEINSRRM